MSTAPQNRDRAAALDAAAAAAASLRGRLDRMQGERRKSERRAKAAEPAVPSSTEPPVPTAPDALRARLAQMQSSAERRQGDRRAAAPHVEHASPIVADVQSPIEPAPPAPVQPEDAMLAPAPRRPRIAQSTSIPHEALERLQHHARGEAAPTPVTPPAPEPPGQIPRVTPHGSGRSELRQALEASKRALKAVGWFSCAINILMLTGPIFMLQVYDRVMTSGSYATLWVLLGLTAALYAVIGVLEFVRSRVITRIGVEIDQRIGDRIFEASLRTAVANPASHHGALRELDSLRQFVAGPAPMTAFDLAWTPIYLLVIFFTHWTLGVAALIGMLALLACTWGSEMQGRAPLAEAGKSAMKSIDVAETGQRNAGAITAMGMLTAYRARWQSHNRTALAWQVLASDKLGGLAAVSKTLRLLMQSLMLAIGAALAIHGDISAGAIIAGTIIFGRALAPVEQVITHWKSSAKAIESFRKLEALLAASPARPAGMTMPRPRGHMVVDGLRVAAPESRTVILAGISCEIRPGRVLAVIGPSASGKSTLLRALVGLWPPFSGTIRLDGHKIDQWNPDDLGRYIGFLPQDVELFSGTVRDNIARFRTDVSDDMVIAAARAAHAHELILGLAKGYDTELGAYGAYLSAGQRQRIGLARALFGEPALVVMDEPNANLDRAGDEALAAAIDGMRKRGQAVVLVSHRVQAIGIADDILYLERGQQRAFGPRDEVLRAMNSASAQQSQQAPQTPRPASPVGAAAKG